TRIVHAGASTQLQQVQLALHPEVTTAAELMRHIARNDLHFAPCADPAAPGYQTLHQRLAQAHREL
ncbi:MAG: hypothetical protein JWM11_2315, partial [Planctomycetaceae bacterium]|nr:hypothetical protein [Planctomycetaceae bacterium]